jgi:hypothetical protein
MDRSDRPTGRLAPVAVAVSLLVAAVAAAQICTGTSPARGVPQGLWSGLRPTDTGQLPHLRDSTDYHGQTVPDSRYPLFSSLDVEDGYVFLSYSTGLQVWNARTPHAGNPQRLALLDGWQGRFLVWPTGHSETREHLFDVDVPDGRGDLFAASGLAPIGLSVWDSTSKLDPRPLYQEIGRTMYQVYTAELGGRVWAFGASEGGVGNGLQVYDMTAARSYPYGCWEDSTALVRCPGVYRGRMGTVRPVSYLDGAALGDGRHLLAASSGPPLPGVELWEVSDPLHPVDLHPSGGRFLPGTIVWGVAVWEHAGRSYLALRTVGAARIYDVTACLDGSCPGSGAPGPLIWSRALPASAVRYFVTDSMSDGVPYLYFGDDTMCRAPGDLRHEWLFEVADPAAPRELGGGGALTLPGPDGTPVALDYWSWYYGYSQVMPRVGKFAGALFYRAAWTVFDVHRRTATTAPTAPPAPPALFRDGFESGGLGDWSSSRP